MEAEVFFDRMVPNEVVQRREICPVAYLPVGALEWHGGHLPFGTDCLTVKHLAERAAREIGGVAFPPLCYGDIRYRTHDSLEEWREEYTREVRIPETIASLFPAQVRRDGEGHEHPMASDEETVYNPLPFSIEEQSTFFANLLAYTLIEIYSYGFRVIMLLTGHGPNTRACLKAEEIYAENTKRRTSLRPAALTKTFAYYQVAKEIEPFLREHWVHADKMETSLVRAIAPETVHLDRLPKDRRVIPPAYLALPYLDPKKGYNERYRQIWGNFEALDPRNSSLEYGEKLLEHSVAELKKEVDQLLTKHALVGKKV